MLRANELYSTREQILRRLSKLRDVGAERDREWHLPVGADDRGRQRQLSDALNFE
jgi:hypothetical protein